METIQTCVAAQQAVVDKTVAINAPEATVPAQAALDYLIGLEGAPLPNPVVTGQWSPPIGETIPDAAWASLPFDEWIEVMGTSVAANIDALLPQEWYRYGRGKDAINSYSGAAIDKPNGRVWFRYGGHGDGNMNGLVEFNLPTMRFRMAVQPTIYTAADMAEAQANWQTVGKNWGLPPYSAGINWNAGWAPWQPYTDSWKDGKACATHSYRTLEWVPEKGPNGTMFSGRQERMWRFDPVTGENFAGPYLLCGNDSSMVHDPVRSKLICMRFGIYDYFHYYTYDIATDSYGPRKSMGGSPGRIVDKVSAQIVGNNLLCMQDNDTSRSAMYAWKMNLDTEIKTDFPLIDAPPKLQSGSSWLGHTFFSCGEVVDDKMYLLQCARAPGIYGSFVTVDVNSGQCGTYTPSGTAPAASAPEGSPYGRFRAWECGSAKMLLLWSAPGENLRIVRLH